MSNLNAYLVADHEIAYRYKNDGTVETLNGGPNGTNFNFQVSDFANTTGFIHSHENNAGNLPIFSAEDFNAMFIAVSAADTADKAGYTFAVVTSAGSYLLSINDLTKFETFKNNNFSPNNPGQFNGFRYAYNIYVNNTKTPAQNEAGLVQFMQTITGGTGLTLMKSVGSSTPAWKTVTNDNGTPAYVNCP